MNNYYISNNTRRRVGKSLRGMCQTQCSVLHPFNAIKRATCLAACPQDGGGGILSNLPTGGGQGSNGNTSTSTSLTDIMNALTHNNQNNSSSDSSSMVLPLVIGGVGLAAVYLFTKDKKKR